ncbi:conserved hypothetical protein [Leptospira interrogans serovar Manilae]|uniref:Uncharacterized protein n=2 Tax=Leptospira interrogans TaxID=173 RepID=A0AAQ1NZ89_LEPIR|nr:hypothetical protein LEP1GSC057_1198 [Leptospira interrogans str. Brem 329]EMJ47690.1 hypothetical protein LEP1GSC111_3587 [Leptospira interrogans str. UT126]EMM96160.1 hypothetical protein LEP1GSC158_2335 [Leptospira interrogans serovar Zanoni str. LT2156]EMN49248.1 hypothetical protein LEP1GSC088_2280 [Leptospira interrogans str. L1207]EMN69573.1 hypothetical protein LEP1GSC100_3812 [Leptospira interrogans serovar Bataviae str. UI 08561]SOR62086.1 conserved hypothetical protein [Leptospir
MICGNSHILGITITTFLEKGTMDSLHRAHVIIKIHSIQIL